jgi:hypothetical protein
VATRWEYHVVTLDVERNDRDRHRIDESHSRKINGLGVEGWELVSVVPNLDDGVMFDVTYVFKRPRNQAGVAK